MKEFKQSAINKINEVKGSYEIIVKGSEESKSGNVVVMWETGSIEIEDNIIAQQILLETGLVIAKETLLAANENGFKGGNVECSDNKVRFITVVKDGAMKFKNYNKRGDMCHNWHVVDESNLPEWMSNEMYEDLRGE